MIVKVMKHYEIDLDEQEASIVWQMLKTCNEREKAGMWNREASLLLDDLLLILAPRQ